jgi:hypothetical protein
MKQFDVFNGDADGLCALHQLRLEAPADAAVLVTGVKRDIALLGRVDAREGDTVTVLDVSADANRAALASLLDRGVHVEYFDHHFAGELPVSRYLHAHIDLSPDTCTSLIVDRHLNGARRAWAIVGAYGDNLPRAARACAESLHLQPAELARLRELGENLAYNAYGDREQDVIIPPADLYRALKAYADPLRFVDEEDVCRRIGEQKRADLDMADCVEPEIVLPGAMFYILPDEAWGRRARGVLANTLANRVPTVAHAVLSINGQGSYTVSLRAPLASPTGADAVCRRFQTGGGRASAAGVNQLPRDKLGPFAEAVDAAFPRAVDAVRAPSLE